MPARIGIPFQPPRYSLQLLGWVMDCRLRANDDGRGRQARGC